MYLNRLGKHIRQQDWFVVIVEVLIVIVGLTLAFQADRWWEERGERKLEVVYVKRLISDIESDIPQLENAIKFAQMRKDFVELLMAVAQDPSMATRQPTSFLVAVDQASFTYTPTLNQNTYEDLRSTGNLRLIRNLEVKNQMHDYYRFHESQRQFRPLQFSVEFHHFKLANGVRSSEQVRFLQDKWLLVSPDDIEEVQNTDPGDPDEILAAARRLQDRPELVSWLTQLREMQMEQILINNTRMTKAEEVIEALDEYYKSIESQ